MSDNDVIVVLAGGSKARKPKKENKADVVVLDGDCSQAEKPKKKRLAMTVWDRLNTLAMVKEMDNDEDDKGDPSNLPYGQKTIFWDKVADGMRKLPKMFDSFPSGNGKISQRT
jgi:hypothetical protein